MYCKQCGSYLEPGALTCPVCGAPVPEEQPAGPSAETQPAGEAKPHAASWEFGAGVTGGPETPPPPPAGGAPRYQQPDAPVHREQEDAPEPPVKTLEWLWSLILTVIPVVNLVVLLIWSFGGGISISKRNWARAKLILVVVSTVISIIVAIALVGIVTYNLSGYGGFGYGGFDTPHHYYY